MFPKNALDSSGAGRILPAGANGGPDRGYRSLSGTTGGGGWRVRKEGSMMK